MAGAIDSIRGAIGGAVRGVKVGDGSLALIAGPCSVETREQTMRTAEAVSASGAKFFRGGAFKPRTSPYAFQGLKEEGLHLLGEVKRAFDLRIVTEVKDVESLEAVLDAGGPRPQLLLVARVGEREHRLRMLDLPEPIEGPAADALGGGIRGAKLRMGLLQLPKLVRPVPRRRHHGLPP